MVNYMKDMLTFATFYLNEARQQNLEYSEKMAKDQIDKVIVELAGTQSAIATKLAKKFKVIKEAAAKLKSQEEELNVEAKDLVSNLFDAEDVVYTRIVKTCSLTIQVSKEYQRETTKVDTDGIMADILKLAPELEDKIKEIVKARTKITKSNVMSALTIKSESITLDEGVLDSIKKFFVDLLSKFQLWAKSFDTKLDTIEKQLAAA